MTLSSFILAVHNHSGPYGKLSRCLHPSLFPSIFSTISYGSWNINLAHFHGSWEKELGVDVSQPAIMRHAQAFRTDKAEWHWPPLRWSSLLLQIHISIWLEVLLFVNNSQQYWSTRLISGELWPESLPHCILCFRENLRKNLNFQPSQGKLGGKTRPSLKESWQIKLDPLLRKIGRWNLALM